MTRWDSPIPSSSWTNVTMLGMQFLDRALPSPRAKIQEKRQRKTSAHHVVEKKAYNQRSWNICYLPTSCWLPARQFTVVGLPCQCSHWSYSEFGRIYANVLILFIVYNSDLVLNSTSRYYWVHRLHANVTLLARLFCGVIIPQSPFLTFRR